MSIPELSIRRHALAVMGNAIFVLFGIIGFTRMGVDKFPYVEFPIISVQTTMMGANPDVIDAAITNVLETSINATPGIDYVQSFSLPGRSAINIIFVLNKDIDVAFNEVKAKVDEVLQRLPQDADPPVISKVETASAPILWLVLRGNRTIQQLNQYARVVVKKRLETVDGVGQVQIGGERKRTIRIEADLAKMAALGVTAMDLRSAVANEHLQLPGGYMTHGKIEWLIKLDQEYHDPWEMRNLVVGYRQGQEQSPGGMQMFVGGFGFRQKEGGAPILLKDVADVTDGMEDERQAASFKGEPTVGLGIVKVRNTNSVKIIEEVLKRLDEEIRPALPPGITLDVSYNDAVSIEEITGSLTEHLIWGTALAALVVLFFLADLRATAIVFFAIPVSLFAAAACMYFFGYTMNSMTLLAMLLLIGVVVDDAIVVLENIHRHLTHLDPNPFTAARRGAEQVFFAVMAATLSLACIFVPVVFMPGMVGKFFQSFAIVMTMGVFASLFVSVTLTPMLCSRFLKAEHHPGPLSRAILSGFVAMDEAYRRMLRFALGRRWLTLAMALAVVSTSAYFITHVESGFIPETDESRFMIFFRTPLGSSVAYTKEQLSRIEEVLKHYPEVRHGFATVGLGVMGRVNEGTINVELTPRQARKKRQQTIMAEVQKELALLPGVQAYASPIPPINMGTGRGEPLNFALAGPNLQEVGRFAHDLQDKLNQIPRMGRVDLDLPLDLPQQILEIDRVRAASFGFNAAMVSQAVNTLLGGDNVAYYNDRPGDGERYDVRIKAREDQIGTPRDLEKIWLKSPVSGELVRADTLARFVREPGPQVISRHNLQYAAMFYANPSMALGSAVAKVNAFAKDLPMGYHVSYIGQAKDFGEAVVAVGFAIFLSMILLYMVLASQFNSYIQPLILMAAQPLAIVGALFALWLTHYGLIVYSMLGMILLIGMVAKNSILLVDLTNQLRAEGKSIDEALLEACPVRLRPVLMTSLTVILAMLPTAMGMGAGSEWNAPLAVAVVGGMVSSTFLTLLVVPPLYSLVEKGVQAVSHRRSLVRKMRAS